MDCRVKPGNDRAERGGKTTFRPFANPVRCNTMQAVVRSFRGAPKARTRNPEINVERVWVPGPARSLRPDGAKRRPGWPVPE